MARATITIVGLGKVGTSLGLALNTPENDLQLIGHDKDSGVAKESKSRGAVDSTAWNLISACEQADAIILAIPFDQIEATLQAIGDDLKIGTVVIDTSPFSQPVLQWADQYLAETAHFVSVGLGRNPAAMMDLTPGPAGARSDLFADAPCCIMPSVSSPPEAVKMAQDLATLLDATPYFLDPAEYDGLSTVVNLVPALLAGSLLSPAIASPGWREMRRLGSSDLLYFSQPLKAGNSALALETAHNRENVLRWLDTVMVELQTIREQVADGEDELLAHRLGAIHNGLEAWLIDWQQNEWERTSKPAMPSTGGWFRQLFGFGRRKDQDRE
jgi:prephenate dehydrogenase